MKPKKSLGQNFLKDKVILDKIMEAADLKADDLVIEIGPGEGALTKELIKHAKRVIAIEKDDSLAEKLAHNFQFSILNSQSISNEKKINFKNKTIIIIGDILKINLPNLIEALPHPSLIPPRRDSSHPLPKGEGRNVSYKVVANIPYYITSPILQLFLETKYPPTEMILMVQREVAQRIVACPGQMSVLAVSVQYYAQAELLFYVSKKSFWPVPEVDSAVIHITHSVEHITSEERKKFFRIVRAGFSSKRKTLLNNLSNSLHLDKKNVEENLKKAGLKPDQRAQELSIEDWKNLANNLSMRA